MIRVLVVDDSETMRLIMRKALAADPEFEVVAEAGSGQEALAAVRRHLPDVITMDILMPGLNGLDATRMVMEESPRPIVMVSAVGDREEQKITFEAMEAGAVWLVRKPRGSATADWQSWSRSFREVVKSMAAVKVVRRRPKPAIAARPAAPAHARGVVPPCEGFDRVIAIAASTGGPTALLQTLSPLPSDYPFPILVCQHIADGFVAGLADWLRLQLRMPVRVAEGSMPLPCGVTLAPDGANLELAGRDRIEVRKPDGADHYVPSADRLFSSLARSRGREAIGIIMTGMGQDGARGLRELYDAGAWTVAQDEASSLIYGMPRAAREAGAARQELNLEQISDLLSGLRWQSARDGVAGAGRGPATKT